MDGERRAVEVEQPRIEPLDRCLVRRVRPAEPGPQHRPAAGEGGRRDRRSASSGRPMPASASAAFAAAIRSAEVSASVPSRSNTATRMMAPPVLSRRSLWRQSRKENETESDRSRPSPVLQPLLEHRQRSPRRPARMPTAVIVLAAGQGTRMNSDLPKVLHPLAGVPLIAHALAAARGIEPERTILVTGHGGDAVAAAAREFADDLRVVRAGRAARHRPRGAAGGAGARRLQGRRDRALRRHAVRPPRDAAGDARRARRPGAGVVVLGFEARGSRRLRPAGARRRGRARGDRRGARRRRRDAGDPALQLGPPRRRRRRR